MGVRRVIFQCPEGFVKVTLSLLLFCLAEDFLSHKIFAFVSKGSFALMYGSQNFNCPTHLMYADDVIIFGKASRANIDLLAAIVLEYGVLSGQLVNWEKYDIFFK